jgi:nucleoside-diphosphate-sugar epimerase
VIFEGHFKRNYLHVMDAAGAFADAVECVLRPGIFNVGLSDANLSKLELCEKIKKHVPAFTFVEAAIGEDPDKRDYVVSNAKIEATGWCPTRSLDDGIIELMKGYQMIRNSRYGNV